MTKKKNGISVEIVTGLQSISVKEPRPTTFIEEREESYPFCVLPENFFDFALARQSLSKETTLLSIDSWDGREILSVIRKQ